MKTRLVLFGCGNMGFSMLQGWTSQKTPPTMFVIEPVEALRLRAQQSGAHAVAELSELPHGPPPDFVVLAVKPQMVVPVLRQAAAIAGRQTTFVSLAAGITISTMATALPNQTRIVRCMPNTPAMIRQGMLAYCTNDAVSSASMPAIEELLAVVGQVERIASESLMDAVTAISGSGPAYVFLFVEALIEAGKSLGLPSDTAKRLAKQTVAGTGQLISQSQLSVSTLREQVTSPNGTTAAALNVLMQDNALLELVREAAMAARKRGVELGSTG